MKKLLAILMALLLMATVCLPVTAAGLNIPTVTYEGKSYYDLSSKQDYFKAARYGIDNGMTAVSVHIVYSKISDYVSNNIWYCNVNNFDYTQEGLYFSYREYAPSTVCMTGYHHLGNEEYGDIEISYIDSAEELKQGDKLLDAELAKVSSYSKKDKIRYVAEYICKNVDAGFKQMPGGGYDTINGVYDLMTGVRTNVVCSSFAFLFQRFMERAGYKSYIATGGNHAWNVVELDGKWYGVDCTYGDNGKLLDEEYFLMGMDRLKGYITATENVFAELEKEQGCQFAQASYGAKATTTTPTNKPIATKTPATTTSRPANTTTTTGEAVNAPTSADEITTTTTTQEGEEPPATTTAAPVVTVDISDTAKVAPQVFESAVQNGETLVLKAQEYQWSFEASKLTNVSDSAPINTAINLGSAVAQEDIAVLEKLNKEETFFPFSFEHHGALPGEAEISIRVDESFADKAVNIYSVNADGEAVLEGTGTVSADGQLTFTTNHCSLWFIKEAQPVSAAPSGMIWLIVAVAAVLIIGGGVTAWLLLRKKR